MRGGSIVLYLPQPMSPSLCSALMQNIKQPLWMVQEKKQIPVTEILVVRCIFAFRCTVSMLVTFPPPPEEYKMRDLLCAMHLKTAHGCFFSWYIHSYLGLSFLLHHLTVPTSLSFSLFLIGYCQSNKNLHPFSNVKNVVQMFLIVIIKAKSGYVSTLTCGLLWMRLLSLVPLNHSFLHSLTTRRRNIFIHKIDTENGKMQQLNF